MKGRRRLLEATAAVLGGGIVFSRARPANAWHVEQVDASSPTGLAYADRCGADSEHAALQAELRAALLADPARPSMTATCPVCGCIVGVSR